MNQEVESKQFYRVLFWAFPRSGFDLAQKNTIMKLFRDTLSDEMSSEQLKRFEEKNEGLVVYEEVIESDELDPDPDREVMPIIKKKFPDAQYIVMIPITVETN